MAGGEVALSKASEVSCLMALCAWRSFCLLACFATHCGCVLFGGAGLQRKSRAGARDAARRPTFELASSLLHSSRTTMATSPCTCTAQRGKKSTSRSTTVRSSAVLGRLLNLFVACGGTLLSHTRPTSTHALVLLPPTGAGRAPLRSASGLGLAGSRRSEGQQERQKFSSLQKQYEKAGGILYRQSVLSQEEFDVCRRDLLSLIGKGGSLRLADETTSSVASNRVGGRIPPGSAIADVLRNPRGSISRLINEVEGKVDDGDGRMLVLSDDVPVEVRIYEKEGAGMEWHVDDVLYSPSQVEVVLTMENNSDCITIWEEGESSSSKRVEAAETTPNSAILIKAGGARHKVSSLKNGRRVILKFVYVQKGAALIDGAEQHTQQFASSSSSSSSSSRSKKRTKRGAAAKKYNKRR